MADEDNKEAAKSEESAPASEKLEKAEAAPASEKPAKVEAAPASEKPAKSEKAEAAAASKKAVEKSATNGGSAPAPAHGHAPGHDDHGHGLAHTMPVPMLIGILAALMALTILTVSVTSFDLGAQGNLIVAMVIATVKAALVVAFFMHLVWDKKLHLILFLTSVLFLILFLSLSVNDRGEYQSDIDAYTNSAAK